MERFYFSDGEATARRAAQVDMVHWLSPPTKRAPASGKPFGPEGTRAKSFVFGSPYPDTTFVEALGLGPNSLRQNDSIWP
jgi:hypothetical protein